MNDRVFFVILLILAIAVAVAVWQFRSLAWGDEVAGSHTIGKPSGPASVSGQSILATRPR
jgi:hypothetical protein